jgi:hypothetical protein
MTLPAPARDTAFSSPHTILTRGTRPPATATKVQRLHLLVHYARKVICRAGQAHPDKQHVLLGVLPTSVQPRQYGDRDIGGRTPGAAFLPPGEVINVRLEHIQRSELLCPIGRITGTSRA